VTGDPPVRILIADRDASTRVGIRVSLAEHGFEVCAEADSADTARAAALRARPDLCLLEADLPGGGASAAADIVEQVYGTVVVMLGANEDDEPLLDALRAGARGYLLKDMDPARLPATLRGALSGEAALPRALTGRVLDEVRLRSRYSMRLSQLGVPLTRREMDVLELLDRGLDTGGIAAGLGISSVTVRRHVSEILRKLEVPDRDAALQLLRRSPG
jgi:DNA-binding NarL/FixJ family response regulator